MDLYNFVGKDVMVTLYRKKYSANGKIKVYTGVLTDINRTSICLEKDGKCRWIPRPNHYRDGIKELK